MNLKDILKFQFKRVNPFPGLVIDADTWRDAHKYSRDQQRLHNLMFHQVGITQGLEVTENDPPDMTVNINPGIAIDPEGNTIIVPNIYHYKIQNRDKETVYLIIQFREILEGPYQPPEGGQPTRILDGYRIQERDNLPDEPHLELARIDLDPAEKAIRNAGNKQKPAKNEINLNFRLQVRGPAAGAASKQAPILPPDIISVRRRMHLGHASLDGAASGLHIQGIRNLARELETRYDWTVELEEDIVLDDTIKRFDLIYLTGGSDFKLAGEQTSALETFIKYGGVLLAEDCNYTGTPINGNKGKQGPVYNELTDKFKLKLKPVGQGDPLLSSINVFSEAPPGAGAGVFLRAENVLYTDNDYGCAWQGGREGSPISRDVIRSAFEFGANIVEYACQVRSSSSNNEAIAARQPLNTGT